MVSRVEGRVAWAAAGMWAGSFMAFLVGWVTAAQRYALRIATLPTPRAAIKN